MSSLADLNLKYDPFREVTPSLDGDNLVWAEMEDVKSKMKKSYDDCINHRSKQVVLNWGKYGGGKTFSAYYFIKEYRQTKNLTQLYLRCPKDGGTATDEFFKGIIDFLSFDSIHEHIKSLLNEHGEKKLMDYLAPKASREYAKAICLIGSDDDNTKTLMNRFLYAGLTKTELGKLGLAKAIQTDTDSIKFLSGLLSCFIGDDNIYSGKVILWIDEMEDLIYYSQKNYKAFSQVLRDLFDSISNGFLVFMNFTLAEGEESTVELILGGAIWSRVTKKIRFKQFTEENAKTYCVELLNYSKANVKEDKPFTKDNIEKIITYIPAGNLTPREINKHFSSLINYGLDKDLKTFTAKNIAEWATEYQENNS